MCIYTYKLHPKWLYLNLCLVNWSKYTHTYTHIHKRTYKYTHTHAHTRTHTHTHTRTHTYANKACVYVSGCLSVNACVAVVCIVTSITSASSNQYLFVCCLLPDHLLVGMMSDLFSHIYMYQITFLLENTGTFPPATLWHGRRNKTSWHSLRLGHLYRKPYQNSGKWARRCFYCCEANNEWKGHQVAWADGLSNESGNGKYGAADEIVQQALMPTRAVCNTSGENNRTIGRPKVNLWIN